MSGTTKFNRREFLAATGASAVVTCGTALAPGFLLRAAASESKQEDRILVVVQLSGGNDGLNTIIPYADPQYYASRPKLAVAKDDVLRIDDSLGFHPSMKGFAELLQQQKLAIVQGVGYPDPNRSHFESMDIWHTCRRKGQARDQGWLGRYLQRNVSAEGGDVPGIHIGHEKQPLALTALETRVTSIRSLEGFQLNEGRDKGIRETIEEVTRAPRGESDDLLDFVQSSASAALDASRRVEQARTGYDAKAQYPDSQFGQKLRKIAQLIHAGMKTRVYYVTLDGFDTHARQADAHAILLEQFSEAVTALVSDLSHQGTDDRVTIMAFSEFGRRVSENASEGTDHGTAAPMFLIGSDVTPGLIGEHPRLDDLEQGDLKHRVDFRQVYGCVLERWLACDSRAILGADFEPVNALKA